MCVWLYCIVLYIRKSDYDYDFDCLSRYEIYIDIDIDILTILYLSFQLPRRVNNIRNLSLEPRLSLTLDNGLSTLDFVAAIMERGLGIEITIFLIHFRNSNWCVGNIIYLFIY